MIAPAPNIVQSQINSPHFTDIDFDRFSEYTRWRVDRSGATPLTYRSDIVLDALARGFDQAETSRDHMGIEQKQLAERLEKLGWSEDKATQAVNFSTAESAKAPTSVLIKKGERIYSFMSATDNKREASPFYMREAEFEAIKRDPTYCRDGEWDASALKDFYALPCNNACTAIATRTVTRDHQAVETKTGFVSEAHHVLDPNNAISQPIYRHMDGGGGQIFADRDLLEPPRITPIVSTYANPRLTSQRERDLEEYRLASNGLQLALAYPGVDAKDMQERRTLAERRMGNIAPRLVDDPLAMKALSPDMQADVRQRAKDVADRAVARRDDIRDYKAAIDAGHGLAPGRDRLREPEDPTGQRLAALAWRLAGEPHITTEIADQRLLHDILDRAGDIRAREDQKSKIAPATTAPTPRSGP